MVNVFLRSLRWSYARIKKRDIFSQSVSLTYKGSETRRSIIGGWVTIALMIFLLIYSVYLFDRMINKKEISWNQNAKRHNWADPNQTIVWNEEFPNISFTWIFEEGETYEFYYQFADVTILTSSRYPNGTNSNEYIENIECDTSFAKERFPNNQLITIWPNLTGVELRNSEEDTVEKYLIFSLSFWPAENWTVTLNNQVKNHPTTVVEFNIPRKEVDLDNIDEPIRQYPDLYRASEITKNIYTSVLISAKKNEVYLEDDWFPMFGEVEPIVFYSFDIMSVEKLTLSDEPTSGRMVIHILAENEISQYKRKVMTLLEVTGTIGGVFELLEVTVGIFIGFYSSYMFKKDIKKDLNQAEIKYREVQESIRKLQLSQLEIMDRFHIEEEKKQSIHQMINTENIAHPNQEYNLKQMRREIKEIKMRRVQQTNQKIAFENENSQKEDTFDNFKESLDCIDIVYSLKTLRLQVDYLLSKDPEYKSRINQIQKPNQEQNMKPLHNLPTPFEPLSPKVKNKRFLNEVSPNPKPNQSSFPVKNKQGRYQRVQRYLDED